MIDPADIAIVVQTIPERVDALKDTLRSAGHGLSQAPNFRIVAQLPQETKKDNFRNALQGLVDSGCTWGLRLEDDLIVNKHLLHNLSTWGAVDEWAFGAGWLWHSNLLALRRDNLLESENGFSYRDAAYTTGSLGVLMRTDRIKMALPRIEENWDAEMVNGAQDKALSLALWQMGMRIYLHESPLVEHNVKHVSTQAPDRPVDPRLHTTGGNFDPNWRRSEPGATRLGVAHVF